jgi:hypothetical protein
MIPGRNGKGKFCNDSELPAKSGGRSLEAEATARRLRRFRRVRGQLLADRGGEPTQAQEILADNAAGLAIRLEEQITAMFDGQPINVSELNGSMNTLRRLLETLGIERQPRDITTLESYLAERSRQTVNGNVAQ